MNKAKMLRTLLKAYHFQEGSHADKNVVKTANQMIRQLEENAEKVKQDKQMR